MDAFFQRVYALVRRVPPGRVVTYGQVAKLIGRPGAARTVGWALHAIGDPDSGIPWHRVINARGGISSCTEHSDALQRQLLESEGVRCAPGGTINLDKYQWRPRPRKGQRAAAQGSKR